MTVIGTLSHESGHYIAARLMGYHARINYGMTWLTDDSLTMNTAQEYWFIAGGPLQTMLTGSIGFLLLYRSVRPVKQLNIKQWALVFCSLFWLRQLANATVLAFRIIFNANLSTRADEVKLSRLLHWPYWSIVFITAIPAIAVLFYVILKYLPARVRACFILAGLAGGTLGYLTWLVWWGKLLLP